MILRDSNGGADLADVVAVFTRPRFLVEKWAEKLQPHFERFAEWLGPALESAIDGIASKLSGMVTWVQDNEKALKPLVVMVGAATVRGSANHLDVREPAR